VRVHNVTVEGAETYFAGDTGVLVHNKPAIKPAVVRARAKRPKHSAYFIAKWLVERGTPELVWEFDRIFRYGHFFRGEVAENIARLLRYDSEGFGHVGGQFGGTFEWDFHKTKRVVSYKSLQLRPGASRNAYHARI